MLLIDLCATAATGLCWPLSLSLILMFVIVVVTGGLGMSWWWQWFDRSVVKVPGDASSLTPCIVAK